MSFLGIIPEAPSFKTQLARGLGGGLSAGVAQGNDFASQIITEKFKNAMRQKLINRIEGTDAGNQLGLSGKEKTPDVFSQLLNPGTAKDPFTKAKNYAAVGEHELAKLETERAKLGAKEKAKEKEFSSDKTFWEGIHKDRERLPHVKTSLDAELNAVLSGEVDPFSSAHFADIAKGLGADESLVRSLETPGSQSFKTAQKTFIGNTLQDVTRGTTSGKQIELVEGLLAKVGSSKEANLAAVWLLQAQNAVKEKKIQLAAQYKKEGISGYEIPDLVSDEVENYRKKVSEQYIEAINSLM